MKSQLLFASLISLASLACTVPSLKAQDRTQQTSAPNLTAAVAAPNSSLTGAPSESSKESIRASYIKLPLYFEPNEEQTEGDVKFISHGLGYGLFLTPTEAVLALRNDGASDVAMRMKLYGANSSPRVTGMDMLEGRTNYFIGNNPANWRTDVPTYRKVKYEGVYPGVDLIYYGNQQQLEYDFVVAPGADPRSIRFQLKGAGHVEITASGDIVAHAGTGYLVFHKPVVYQQSEKSTDGMPGDPTGKEFIDGRFVLAGKDEIAFEVASYDAAKPLVIDPAINFSTFLGGNAEDAITGVAVDTLGRMYLTGWTRSSNFGAQSASRSLQSANLGPFKPCSPAQDIHCGGDVFVARISADGSTLDYSTFLGGTGIEYATGIAVDSAFRAVVVGVTESSNFPATALAMKPDFPAKSGQTRIPRRIGRHRNLSCGLYLYRRELQQ